MKRSGLKRAGGLKRSGLQRSTKPINKEGRITKERRARKIQWELDHPPLINQHMDGEKHYYCHICIYFNEPIRVAYVAYERYVLEHITPKGRLSLAESQEDSNLGPSHVLCNNEKGSMTLWEMEKSPMSGLPNPYPSESEYQSFIGVK